MIFKKQTTAALLFLSATASMDTHGAVGLRNISAFFSQAVRSFSSQAKVTSPQQRMLQEKKENYKKGCKDAISACNARLKIQKKLDAALLKSARITSLWHFIDAGADVKATNANGSTALHFAARKADNQAVKMLLAKGANATAKNNQGATPIALAIDTYSDCKTESNEKTLRLLAEDCAADPSAHYEALRHAAFYGTLDACRILATTPCVVNHAGSSIDELVARELKELRTTLMQKDSNGKMLYQQALSENKNELAALLHPDTVDKHRAAIREHIVKYAKN